MSLRDQQRQVLAAHFAPDRFGQVVEYNGLEIDAIFRQGEQPGRPHSGTGSASVADLQVMRDDVPAWNRGDKVQIDGETWSVQFASKTTWFKFVLRIERDRRTR